MKPSLIQSISIGFLVSSFSLLHSTSFVIASDLITTVVPSTSSDSSLPLPIRRRFSNRNPSQADRIRIEDSIQLAENLVSEIEEQIQMKVEEDRIASLDLNLNLNLEADHDRPHFASIDSADENDSTDSAPSSSSSSTTSLVNTDCGPVSGSVDSRNKIASFKGIPYALPPTGARRWTYTSMLKESNSCWAGTFAATKYSPMCAQNDLKSGSKVQGSEDCLYLNVWTPTSSLNRSKKLPVILYIFGGGLTQGGSDDPPGDTLSHTMNVVTVTLNYRLGPFGYMALTPLSQHSSTQSSGNYGLHDQIQALKWIQQNIAAFGGDPSQVTISGQSSGGTSVIALIASPVAVGLFNRAFTMSGSPLFEKDLPTAERENSVFLTNSKCSTGTLDDQYSCLQALSTQGVLDATPWSPYPNWASLSMDMPTPGELEGAMLILDPIYLPKAPVDAAAAHIGSDVSVIVASTAQETDSETPGTKEALGIDSFTSQQQFTDLIQMKFKGFNNIGNDVLQAYSNVNMASDLAENCPAGDASCSYSAPLVVKQVGAVKAATVKSTAKTVSKGKKMKKSQTASHQHNDDEDDNKQKHHSHHAHHAHHSKSQNHKDDDDDDDENNNKSKHHSKKHGGHKKHNDDDDDDDDDNHSKKSSSHRNNKNNNNNNNDNHNNSKHKSSKGKSNNNNNDDSNNDDSNNDDSNNDNSNDNSSKGASKGKGKGKAKGSDASGSKAVQYGPYTSVGIKSHWLYETIASDIGVTCGMNDLAQAYAANFESPVYRYVLTSGLSDAKCSNPNEFCNRFAFHTFDEGAWFTDPSVPADASDKDSDSDSSDNNNNNNSNNSSSNKNNNNNDNDDGDDDDGDDGPDPTESDPFVYSLGGLLRSLTADWISPAGLSSSRWTPMNSVGENIALLSQAKSGTGAVIGMRTNFRKEQCQFIRNQNLMQYGWVN